MKYIDNSTLLAYGIISGQTGSIFPILPGSSIGATGPTGGHQVLAPTGPAGITGPTGPQLPPVTGPTGPNGVGFEDNGVAVLSIANYATATNQTLFLFGGAETVFDDLNGWFVFEGGPLFSDFFSTPEYFVVIAHFVVSCSSGALEEVFGEIGINFNEYFTFGYQKYSSGSNPTSVVLDCCKIVVMDSQDNLTFWLTTTGCSATECKITGYINAFPLSAN